MLFEKIVFCVKEFLAISPTEFDACDIKVYEEVALSNYHTRVLALVGAVGVGKRSLINKLVRENPRRFQAPISRKC